MNARTGKLSKRELETLNKAWGIVSRWMDWADEHDVDTEDYQYESAGNAVCGLCEFIGQEKLGRED